MQTEPTGPHGLNAASAELAGGAVAELDPPRDAEALMADRLAQQAAAWLEQQAEQERRRPLAQREAGAYRDAGRILREIGQELPPESAVGADLIAEGRRLEAAGGAR
jgi:hypothetical protein